MVCSWQDMASSQETTRTECIPFPVIIFASSCTGQEKRSTCGHTISHRVQCSTTTIIVSHFTCPGCRRFQAESRSWRRGQGLHWWVQSLQWPGSILWWVPSWFKMIHRCISLVQAAEGSKPSQDLGDVDKAWIDGCQFQLFRGTCHIPINGCHIPINGGNIPIIGCHIPIIGRHIPVKGFWHFLIHIASWTCSLNSMFWVPSWFTMIDCHISLVQAAAGSKPSQGIGDVDKDWIDGCNSKCSLPWKDIHEPDWYSCQLYFVCEFQFCRFLFFSFSKPSKKKGIMSHVHIWYWQNLDRLLIGSDMEGLKVWLVQDFALPQCAWPIASHGCSRGLGVCNCGQRFEGQCMCWSYCQCTCIWILQRWSHPELYPGTDADSRLRLSIWIWCHWLQSLQSSSGCSGGRKWLCASWWYQSWWLASRLARSKWCQSLPSARRWTSSCQPLRRARRWTSSCQTHQAGCQVTSRNMPSDQWQQYQVWQFGHKLWLSQSLPL